MPGLHLWNFTLGSIALCLVRFLGPPERGGGGDVWASGRLGGDVSPSTSCISEGGLLLETNLPALHPDPQCSVRTHPCQIACCLRITACHCVNSPHTAFPVLSPFLRFEDCPAPFPCPWPTCCSLPALGPGSTWPHVSIRSTEPRWMGGSLAQVPGDLWHSQLITHRSCTLTNRGKWPSSLTKYSDIDSTSQQTRSQPLTSSVGKLTAGCTGPADYVPEGTLLCSWGSWLRGWTVNKEGNSQRSWPWWSLFPATRSGSDILFQLQDSECARKQDIHILTFKSVHLIFYICGFQCLYKCKLFPNTVEYQPQ